MFATYAASKAFLLHYAEALAEELSDAPVDVLALCPGATRTRFFERANMTPVDSLPQMHEPDRVAREGLQALGHRIVHVVGPGNLSGDGGRPASCPAAWSPPRPSGRCARWQ